MAYRRVRFRAVKGKAQRKHKIMRLIVPEMTQCAPRRAHLFLALSAVVRCLNDPLASNLLFFLPPSRAPAQPAPSLLPPLGWRPPGPRRTPYRHPREQAGSGPFPAGRATGGQCCSAKAAASAGRAPRDSPGEAVGPCGARVCRGGGPWERGRPGALGRAAAVLPRGGPRLRFPLSAAQRPPRASRQQRPGGSRRLPRRRPGGGDTVLVTASRSDGRGEVARARRGGGDGRPAKGTLMLPLSPGPAACPGSLAGRHAQSSARRAGLPPAPQPSLRLACTGLCAAPREPSAVAAGGRPGRRRWARRG